jgi:hypothetical protein
LGGGPSSIKTTKPFLGQKKSKPGAMIVLFFSKQPSPSYFRPVVGDPSSIKTTKSLVKKNPNLEQNPLCSNVVPKQPSPSDCFRPGVGGSW